MSSKKHDEVPAISTIIAAVNKKKIAMLEKELEGRRSEANEADQILGRLLGYPEHPEEGQIITAPHTLLSLCDEVVGAFQKIEDSINLLTEKFDVKFGELQTAVNAYESKDHNAATGNELYLAVREFLDLP